MRRLPFKSYFPTALGLWRNYTAREAIFPVYASFKLTSRCLFDCPFCNVKKAPNPDLPTSDIKAILDNLSRSSVLLTSFEGGEPLLRKDIGELLRHARRCSFYLLFTTSMKNIFEYPLEEYARFIDFFHLSIDEGHDNLELLSVLPRIAELPTQVSVQTVVTADSIDALDDKVERCWQAGVNIVVMPATSMDKAVDCFPDIGALEAKINSLRRQYPNTIHTPQGYFSAYIKRKCSPASIIIAPDGRLYYPCHIRGTKGPDLRTHDLNGWLNTNDARNMRQQMRHCERNCGWYQYYAIASYTSIVDFIEAVRPMLHRTFPKKQRSDTPR
jgi:MoaA/NifB/PqqE/SkfB family radical SAM enzyme